MQRMFVAMLVLAGGSPLLAETAPAKKDPVICQQQQQTGTRTARAPKICHTASEWKLLSMQQRDGLGRSTAIRGEIYPPNPKGY